MRCIFNSLEYISSIFRVFCMKYVKIYRIKQNSCLPMCAYVCSPAQAIFMVGTYELLWMTRKIQNFQISKKKRYFETFWNFFFRTDLFFFHRMPHCPGLSGHISLNLADHNQADANIALTITFMLIYAQTFRTWFRDLYHCFLRFTRVWNHNQN